MRRIMLKSKIHRAIVTGADLHYEGSLGIDVALMEAADILPGEQVHVFNVHTGSRLTTYAIELPRHSGGILLNGAAARLGAAGDPVIILTFTEMDDAEARAYQPVVVHVNDRNQMT